MGKSNYSEDFKRDAVHQIAVRGYPVRETAVSNFQVQLAFLDLRPNSKRRQ